jgi:hypothetical protein
VDSIRTMIDQAQAAYARFSSAHNPDDLFQAADAWDVLLMHPALPRLPAQARAQILSNGGNLHHLSYLITRDPHELDASLRCWEQALEPLQRAIDEGSTDPAALPVLLASMAGVHEERYARDSSPTSLVTALSLWARAVEKSSPESPYLPGYLRKLGRHHFDLYRTQNHLESLDEAIRVWGRAVELAREGSDQIIDSLDELAMALTERYVRSATLDDLQSAILIQEEAIRRMPGDWPRAPAVLNNHSRTLHHRFVRTGNLDDSARCIDALKQALALTRDPSLQDMIMTSLDTALKARYVVTWSERELSEIREITLRRTQFPRQRPVASRADERAYQTIADYLLSEYLLSGREQEGQRLIDLAQQLVGQAGHPLERSSQLFRLAMVHLGQYLEEGRPDDLFSAISALEDAMGQQILDSPNLPRFLSVYAIALYQRALLEGGPENLEAAIKAFAFAVTKAEEIAPSSGIHVALLWGQWATHRECWSEAVFAYDYGWRALRQLFRSQLTRTHKEVWLQQAIDLPAFGAYARAKDHNPEAAVEALEDGRALLLSEALGVDWTRLVRLGQVGRADLQERFNAATERWNELLGNVESNPHPG